MVGFCKEEFDALSSTVELPPGFRFHPTDEEIIIHYLMKKVMDPRFTARAIGDVDINKCEPWDLPRKATTGEKESFFFCQKDRKYPTGMRTNRATESGYWKATGKDKEIKKYGLIGMKKTLVFYKGRAPKGEKTNWVLHEYRLEGNFPAQNISKAAKDEWVVCKVFDKGPATQKTYTSDGEVACIDSLMNYNLNDLIKPSLIDYSCSFERPDLDFQTNREGKFLEPSNPRQQPVITTQNSNSSVHNAIQDPFFCFPHSVYEKPSYPDYPIRIHYPSNVPYRGDTDVASPRHMIQNVGMHESHQTTKIEHFSSNKLALCHSQDTGISSEFANEITTMHSSGDNEKNRKFLEELEDLPFSPNVSDLCSLWCN